MLYTQHTKKKKICLYSITIKYRMEISYIALKAGRVEKLGRNGEQSCPGSRRLRIDFSQNIMLEMSLPNGQNFNGC